MMLPVHDDVFYLLMSSRSTVAILCLQAEVSVVEFLFISSSTNTVNIKVSKRCRVLTLLAERIASVVFHGCASRLAGSDEPRLCTANTFSQRHHHHKHEEVRLGISHCCGSLMAGYSGSMGLLDAVQAHLPPKKSLPPCPVFKLHPELIRLNTQ